MSWTTEESDFESRYGQECSLVHVIRTHSGAHRASYLKGIGGSFSKSKATGAWSWPLTSNYCRVQENVDVYIYSSICLHGLVLNWVAQDKFTNFTIWKWMDSSIPIPSTKNEAEGVCLRYDLEVVIKSKPSPSKVRSASRKWTTGVFPGHRAGPGIMNVAWMWGQSWAWSLV
jgi:hypothetical protein